MQPNILNRYALAIELLTLGARVSIVSQETDLSLRFVRKAFVNMYARSPSSGQAKTSPQFMFKSSAKHKESTVCAIFLQLLGKQHSIERVINGYRRYRSYIQTIKKAEPLLDFSDAWIVSKWLDAGVIKLVRCGHCRSAKLIISEQPHSVCCVCKN